MASQIREKSVSRHDSIINAQLVKAQQRIRLIDLSASGFGLLASILAYASFMILLDRFFVLSVATRQFFFLFFVLAVSIYSYLFVLRPLRWRVNPHFAARQIESNLESTRNHVINWIDLAGQNVPGVIRTAIGQRAAKDISDVDVEQAISSRWTVWMGSVAAVFAGILALLFLVIGPGPFSSLLHRAFSPFGKPATIATRTKVEILKPEGGHTKLTIGSPLTVVVAVSGRVPATHEKDAPCLLYRHDEQETFRKRYLQQDGDSNWSSTISPLDIGNGIIYKVAAGDHETPEFQVSVQAAPLISDFLATYRYRPYLERNPITRPSRKLEDIRGTEVELLVRTNRKVRDGRLEFSSSDGRGDLLRGELIPDDASSLRFRLVLDRTGKYRLRFTSSEGESYIDPIQHDVLVHPDQGPEVRLIEPGKDVQVPVNGHLEIVGQAQDDHGIRKLSLRMEVAKGAKLLPFPFLPGKLGSKEFGTPRRIEYRDLLRISKLQDEAGKALQIHPGMVLEYWLEAEDGCDYPQPNIGLSNRFKIVIGDPSKDSELEKRQDQAEQRKKEHEKRLEQEVREENQQRKDKPSKGQSSSDSQDPQKGPGQDQQEKKSPDQTKEDSGLNETKTNGASNKGNNSSNSDKKGEELGEGKSNGQSQKNTEKSSSSEENQKKVEQQAEKLKESMDRLKNQGEEKDSEKGSRPQQGQPEKDQNAKKGKGEEEKPGKAKDAGDMNAGEKKQHGQSGQEAKAAPGGESEKKTDKQEEKARDPDPKNGNNPGSKSGPDSKKAGEVDNQGDDKKTGEKKGPDSGNKSKEAEKEGSKRSDKEGDQAGNQQKGAPEKSDKERSNSSENEGGKTGEKEQSNKPSTESNRQSESKSAPVSSKSNKEKPGECKECEGGNSSNRGGGQKPNSGSAAKGKGQPSGQNGDKPGQGSEKSSSGDQPDKKGPPSSEKGKSGPDEKQSGSTSDKSESNSEEPKSGDSPGKAKPVGSEKDKRDPQDGKKNAGDGKGADGGPSDGSSGNSPAGDSKKATPEDVRKLADQLRNGSKENQEKAEGKLREISQKSEKEDTRKMAEEALKGASKETGKNPEDGSRDKPGKKSPDKSEMGAEEKGEKKPNKQGGPGQKAKPSESAQSPGQEKGNQKTSDQPKDSGKGKPSEEGEGNNSGEGARGGQVGGTGGSKDESQPSRPEKPDSRRASDLQLEEFRKKVDKSVLKDANMSPEEFQKFLKDYQELVRKQKGAEMDKDTPPNPGRGGELPSMAHKNQRVEGKGSADEVRGEGQAKPPPEYRDSHKEFLRRLLSPTK